MSLVGGWRDRDRVGDDGIAARHRFGGEEVCFSASHHPPARPRRNPTPPPSPQARTPTNDFAETLGYRGAGIGIKTPVKGHKPCPDDATFDLIHGALRAPAERANALLKGFKALRRITLDPATITKITATALVILHLNNTTPR